MKRISLALPLLLAACGGPAKPASSAADDPKARVAAFESLEDEVLRDLAAIDRRVAQRARITPRDEDIRRIAMAAVLAEDPSIAMVDGAIDPFSFEARARGLAAVKQKIARAPKNLPAAAEGTLPEPAYERELLERLVDEESARLEEERQLPRSASMLVRGIVETWTTPASQDQAAARDRWLQRRLGELRASLGKTPLDVVRARELDDALDALERAMDVPGLAGATQELVRLRETIESQATRAPARSEWNDVARALSAHLGVTMTADELDKALAAAEARSRASASSEILAARLATEDVSARVAPLMFPTAPCTAAVPGSRVRAMSPAPERLVACEIRQDLTRAAATDRPTLAATLAALHDHVVVAQWALDVVRGSATIQDVTAKHPLLARPSPDAQARLERIALARPVSAIAGGLTAIVLLSDNGNPVARARLWTSLGDVPFSKALDAK